MNTFTLSQDHLRYVSAVETLLRAFASGNKRSVEKLAATFGITNQNLVKELTELAIVLVAREIAQDEKHTILQRYQQIVDLYNHQVNLSHRTSHSMIFQQYSTPAPIAFLAGTYVMDGQDKGVQYNKKGKITQYPVYFEPSAGNGLLTIALPLERTWVNEVDEVRSANLATQGFLKQTYLDSSEPFISEYRSFDGVITNPPFGTLDKTVMYDEFRINVLDHLMALRALDTMRDKGRAAIIIGGHTSWDEQGRIQAGKNRIFFNYLYNHYYVDDVLNLDGHKLYSRQGTAFDVRLILISGRRPKSEGYAPLKSEKDTIVSTFDDLWNRVSAFFSNESQNSAMEQVEKEQHAPPEHPKGKEKFTQTRYVDRREIITDSKSFQGRQKEFSKETVDKIVSEGYDKSQDPIIVWKDQEKQKYIVISGHSRWKASEILYEKGDESLRMMPVKVFIGDKDDAMDYALIESNRSGTSEGLKSDLVAYKKAASKGFNKEYLLRYFKPESYLSLLKDIAMLNPSGRFIEYLDSASEQSFPYLKRNAQWIGTLRRIYPLLTDAHENELFDYIYKSGSGLKTSKDTLFKLMDRKLMTLDFDREKPLNLHNLPSSNAYSDPLKEKIKEIENEIEKLERERRYNEDLIVRAKQEEKMELVEKFKNRVSDLNKIILRKIEEKQLSEKMIAAIEKEVTYDLFTSMDDPSQKHIPETGKMIHSDPSLAKLIAIARARARARKRKAK